MLQNLLYTVKILIPPFLVGGIGPEARFNVAAGVGNRGLSGSGSGFLAELGDTSGGSVAVGDGHVSENVTDILNSREKY